MISTKFYNLISFENRPVFSFFDFFAAFFSLGVSKAFFLFSLFVFCCLLMMFSFDEGGANFWPAVSGYPLQYDTITGVCLWINRTDAVS
jgi:hypothetical protein